MSSHEKHGSFPQGKPHLVVLAQTVFVVSTTASTHHSAINSINQSVRYQQHQPVNVLSTASTSHCAVNGTNQSLCCQRHQPVTVLSTASTGHCAITVLSTVSTGHCAVNGINQSLCCQQHQPDYSRVSFHKRSLVNRLNTGGCSCQNQMHIHLSELSADAPITTVVVWQRAFLMDSGPSQQAVKHWTKADSDWSLECWSSLWTQSPLRHQCYSSSLPPVLPPVPGQQIGQWQGWRRWGELHEGNRWGLAQPGRPAGSQRTPECTHPSSSCL